MKQKIIIFLIITIIIPNLYAFNKDTLRYEDKVYDSQVKSVRIFQDGEEFSYPFYELNSNYPLLFSFDKIGTQEDYYYTVIHCTYDWKPSNLFFFEYTQGLEENMIRTYDDSRSTFVGYTHYELLLPNEDLNLKFSGNYLLVVYAKDYDKKRVVCTRRFMIFETLVEVSGGITAVTNGMYRKTSQKIDFTINYKNYEIFDPEREIKPVILQNYQWHNALYGIKPSFLNNEQIIYNWEEKTMFDASNEYRVFDIINLEFGGEHVEKIEFKNPYYYAEIQKDRSRLGSQYTQYTDFNGRYGIRTKRYKNNDFPELQSDYVICKFSLQYNIPLINSDIYLFGELSNFELNNDYKMTYNKETRCFEKLLLLKQGYYNYRYLLYNKDEQRFDYSFFEGSFFDTENDYLLLIYHRSPRKSYDQLINFSIYNSKRNLIRN